MTASSRGIPRTLICSGNSGDAGEQWGKDVPESIWVKPGLGVWSLKELYAHVSRGATTALDLTGRAVDGTPEVPDAARYLEALMAGGVRPDDGVARLAQQWASLNSVTSLA